MLIFGLIQGLLDIALVGLGVSYLIQRRRLLALEHQLHRAFSRLDGNTPASSLAVSSDASINTPLGSAVSTLSERRASPSDMDSATLSSSGRYALAQRMLGEGLSSSEVAKRTGISQTELGLLKKIGQAQGSHGKNLQTH